MSISGQEQLRGSWRSPFVRVGLVAAVGVLMAIGVGLLGPAGAQEPTTTTATTAPAPTTAAATTAPAPTTTSVSTTAAPSTTESSTSTSSPYAQCTPPLKNREDDPSKCYYPFGEASACFDMGTPLASKPQWCQDYLATSTTTSPDTVPGEPTERPDPGDSPSRPRRSGGAKPQFTG